jgi:hypothetical protein
MTVVIDLSSPKSWTNNARGGIKHNLGRNGKIMNKARYTSPSLLFKTSLLQSLKEPIRPVIITIEYFAEIGNVESDILFFNPSNSLKELISIINIPKSYPYQLTIENTNSVAIRLSIDTIKVEKIKRLNMPFYSEEQSQSQQNDMAALLAATQANNAALLNLIQVTEDASNAEIAAENEDLTVGDPVVLAIGTTPTLLSAANDNKRGLLINNQGNTKIKLFATDNAIAATTTYTTGGHIFDMTTKGIYEVPEAFVKTNIYAVGNAANGSVSVTTSTAI